MKPWCITALTVAHKKLPPISKADILKNFKNEKLIVSDSSVEVAPWLKSHGDAIYLLMTSGNFDGLDLNELGGELV